MKHCLFQVALAMVFCLSKRAVTKTRTCAFLLCPLVAGIVIVFFIIIIRYYYKGPTPIIIISPKVSYLPWALPLNTVALGRGTSAYESGDTNTQFIETTYVLAQTHVHTDAQTRLHTCPDIHTCTHTLAHRAYTCPLMRTGGA